MTLSITLIGGPTALIEIDGFRLLTLDSKRGDGAEYLYRRLGWTVLGTIPGYGIDPQGSGLHDAVFFYKELDPPGPR